MSKKVRKIKHETGKQFGYPEDKWARGGGKGGYGRSYWGSSQLRSKAELLNDAIRNHDDDEYWDEEIDNV